MLLKRSTVVGLMGDWDQVEGSEVDANIKIRSITMPSGSPLKQLEDIFAAFIESLKEASSVEGLDWEPLRDTRGIDEAEVEGYLKTIIKDLPAGNPKRGVGVDIVFEAFRRFLRREWKDCMGSVIEGKGLADLRAKSDVLYPGDFEDYFKIFVLDWTPQNKRALKALILLLRDAQNRVENADEKGLLTKAFAELLVEEGDPLEFMSLVDRLVAGADNLFNGNFPSFDLRK
jgi:hypothetical protein